MSKALDLLKKVLHGINCSEENCECSILPRVHDITYNNCSAVNEENRGMSGGFLAQNYKIYLCVTWKCFNFAHSVEIVRESYNVTNNALNWFKSNHRTKTSQAYLLRSFLEHGTAKDTDNDNCSAYRLVCIFLHLNTVPCHTGSATETKSVT